MNVNMCININNIITTNHITKQDETRIEMLLRKYY